MQVVALPGRRSETEPWMHDLLLAAGLPDSGVVRYRRWNSDQTPLCALCSGAHVIR